MYEKLYYYKEVMPDIKGVYTSAHNTHKANTIPCVYIKIHWPSSMLLNYIAKLYIDIKTKL